MLLPDFTFQSHVNLARKCHFFEERIKSWLFLFMRRKSGLKHYFSPRKAVLQMHESVNYRAPRMVFFRYFKLAEEFSLNIGISDVTYLKRNLLRLEFLFLGLFQQTIEDFL